MVTKTREQIEITGQTMKLTFDRYDLTNYELFIRSKALPESELIYDRETDRYTVTAPARFAKILGVDAAADGGSRLPFSLAGKITSGD